MKKRIHDWLPMVSIAWCSKLRINLKYLKQLFPTPKCLKIVNELVNGKQVWLCIRIKMRFCRAKTGGNISQILQAFTVIE